MNSAQNELEQAIEQLYAAFAHIPKPEQIDGCPCCINQQEKDRLLHKPLRELTSDDLGPIWSSCPYTVGDWQTFRYYLPRLVELEALNRYSFPYITSYLSANRRIKEGDICPQSWEESERLALLQFLEVLWRTAPAWPTDPLYCPYDSILESVALLGESIAPYLQSGLIGPPLMRWGLAYFVACFAESWREEQTGFICLEGDFEDDNDPQREQVLADLLEWWHSPELRQMIMNLTAEKFDTPDFLTPTVQNEMKQLALAALPNK